MNEILTVKKKSSYVPPGQANPLDYDYFLDFENATIGDKTITDQSPTKLITPLVGGGNGAFGVVDHPVIGKCFQFNGESYFNTRELGVLTNFTAGYFLLEMGLLKPDISLNQIFTTGNWTNTISSGTAFSMDQYTTETFQMFVNGSSWDRRFAPGPNSKAFTEYKVTRKASGTVCRNVTTGLENSYPNHPLSVDSYFSVGGSADGGVGLVGFLKYLRIKKNPA